MTAFPMGGVIEIKNDRPAVRTVTMFRDTSVADLAAVLEADKLLIDTSTVQADDTALKFDVLGKSGEICHSVNAQTWSFNVPFSDSGPYPDGGSNLTAFISSRHAGAGGWAEIEQVGLAPLEIVWLEETVTLF